MIVEAKDDVLVLSGSLTLNSWETIRTAASLLLKRHSGGVIIDCGLINAVTPEGAETFRDALNYIEAQKARIIVANVPQHVKDALREIPGVKSQLPIVDSVDAARASLMLSEEDAPVEPCRTSAVLMHVSGTEDELHAIRLWRNIALSRDAEIHLAYLIEIPRALPIGSPLTEEENRAIAAIDACERIVKEKHKRAAVVRHIERVRDWSEGILQMARDLNVESLMLTLPLDPEPTKDPTHNIRKVFVKADCEVLLYRKQRRNSQRCDQP